MKALIVAVLLGMPAHAAGVDGWGWVSVGGGLRWVPNGTFEEKAAALGTPAMPRFPLGPQGGVNFSYGFSSLMALAIDVIGGAERLTLLRPDGGRDQFDSVTLAGLLGVSLWGTDVFVKGFMPHVSVQLGPALANVSNPVTAVPERLLLSLSVAGGATYRISERFGVTLEARYLHASTDVPQVAPLNMGGVWFSAFFSIFFPPASKQGLIGPSF